MAVFSLRYIEAAAHDVEEIHDYIMHSDSPAAANRWLDRIEETVVSLTTLPHRGKHPPELLDIGVTDYREIRFKPYRLIYSIDGNIIHIHLVADGRRDLQSLFQRRLLTA